MVRAGVVCTALGRYEGKAAWDAEHVTIDGRKIAWSDVLYLLPDAATALPPRPQQVILKNGEVWGCEVVRLAEMQLTVRSDLFGEKQVDAARIAAIELSRALMTSGSPAPGGLRKPGILYRAKGDAIPGTLLSIDADKVHLDSVLGLLKLPRDGVVAYAFAAAPAVFEKEIDELALIDGTILRGRMQPAAAGFKLQHPLLGEIKVPARLLRSVVRHTAQVSDLTELVPKSAQSMPLTAGGAAARLQAIRGDGQQAPRFIKGLLIEPKTMLRYPQPENGKTATLRALLLPADGALGDAKLRVRIGKEVRLVKDLPAGSPPLPIAVELPASGELELEVDFGDRLRFPCAIILGDPHLILK